MDRKMDFTINPNGPFKVHMLNEEGKRKATTLSLAFQELLNLVQHTTRPQAPFASSLRDPAAQGYPAINELELTQFILKLQEASFYAKRAMAMLPENQQ